MSLPTLTHALNAAADATPGHGVNFIVGEANERRVPYSLLRTRALGVLGHLQKIGAAPGTQVIILVDGLEPFVDAFWGCILGRIVAVPLAPGNADEHKAKFFRVLDRLQSPHLATERKVYDRIKAFALANDLAASLARLDRHVVFMDEITDISKPGTHHAATPDDVAFVQYSSGSTSEPKGVVLTHRNVMTNIDAIGAGVGATPEDSSLSWMPLTHDMGLIGFHLAPLVARAEHWLMPTALFVRRPGLWMAKASEHRVTVTCSPNFGFMHYLKSHDPAKTAALDLSPVRVIFNGAEPIAADLCRQFTDALAPARLAPNVMFPVYGLAEASLAVTFPKVSAPLSTVSLSRGSLGPGDAVQLAEPGSDDAVELVSVGRPVQNCEVRIADDAGAATAPGIVGRILIRGANVSAGYYGDAALTSSSHTSDGYFDTGDLGTIYNGELVVTGRIKDILFVAGQNHFPQDIELVLAQHADIELGRAAATGVRAAHAATDDVLVFLLTKDDDVAAFAAQARVVRRVVNERTGVPVAQVVPIRQFPKTTSGKVQRFALARDFAAGRFDEVLSKINAMPAEAPEPENASGGVEATLLAICQAAMPKHKLAPDDNLFEIGTGSLTLAQIYEKVEAAYPGRLDVTDFFEYPTVRAMAVYLSAKLEAAP
ncbi:MAG: non-ribosomal peptide synthetase [Betaproteobacteria bacterium]